MTYDDNGYCQSFLSTCDAEGNTPAWAFAQIFLEHSRPADEYLEATPEPQWFNGQSILNWLGY